MSEFKNINEYIADQPPEIARRLTEMRDLFHELIPETKESISYKIPAFSVGNEHLYISAYTHHIGMYPMYGIPELDEEMLPYRGKGTKDALHFKHTEPLPLQLIEKIIKAKASK